MKAGIEEHEGIANAYGGNVEKSDTHVAIWDIMIEPTLQVASIIRQVWRPKLLDIWANRPVLMSIVNSLDVNAVAMPGKEADHILICKGLIEHLLGYAWVLFGTREFLPNIGDSKKEQSIDHTAKYFDQRANLKTGAAFVAPICHSRQLISSLIVSHALNIALLHEYGHIFGGHFQLLPDINISAGLDELSVQRTPLPSEVPLSIIEWDADCFASNYLFYLQGNMNVVDGVRSLLSATVKNPDNYSMILWSLACHILFRSISINPTDTYTFNPLQYPSPPLRGFNFYSDMLLRRRSVQGDNKDRDIEVMKIAVMVDMVCAKRFRVQQNEDWFSNAGEENIKMMKAYVPQRQKLEAVRRICESWRPIYRL